MSDYDRFGNLVDENGHDILEDERDYYYELTDDSDFDEEYWEPEFEDMEDDTFFSTDVDPFDSDLGNEY